MSLQNRINKTAQKIDSLTKKMKEMEAPSIKTQAFTDLEVKLQKAQNELQKLRTEQAEWESMGISSGGAWDVLCEKIGKAEDEVFSISAQMDKLKASGDAFTNQVDTDAYRKLETELGNANMEMDVLKKHSEEVYQKMRKTGKVPDTLTKGFKKLSSVLGGVVSKIKKMHSGTKQANKGFSNLARTMKQMILSMAVFQVMFKGIEFLKSGLQNLAVYSGEYNKHMSDLVSSTGMLKNSLAVAFAPILSAVIPYLVKLIDWISVAANAVSRFFAILSGKSTYTKAIKQNKDYAASLDKVGSSADKAKGSLAGFDDLDVLQKNDASSGGGSGASGGADGSGFEEEAVGEISDWAQFFKDAIDAGDWYGVGFLVAEKLNEALAAIDWGFIQDKAAYFATNLALTLNGFINGLDWNLLGSTLANGLNTAFIVAYAFITTFDWSGAGIAIANLLNGAFSTIDWGMIGDTIITGLRGALDMVIAFLAGLDIFSEFNFSGLQTSLDGLWDSLLPFVGTVGDGLFWFLENVLIPLAGWTITEVLPEFLDILSGALEFVNQVITDAQPMLQWFWDDILLTIGEWTGGIIVDVLNGIGDALSWISQNEVAMTVLESLALAIGIVQGAISAYNVVAGIMSIVSGTAAASAGLLGSVLAFLTSPVTIATVVIAALIAIGILLYKNWDEISAKAKEVWDFVQKKFQEFDEFLTSVFTTDWTKSFGTFGSILNSFFANVSNICNSIKRIFGGIIDFVKGVFAGDWEKAWNGIKETFGGILDLMVSLIKTPINGIIGAFEALANGVIGGLNAMIGALNELQFDVPDWVPLIGGGTFGFDIDTIPKLSIPRLANGGITTGSTLANIGEAGREAVLPLENNTGWMDDLADKLVARMPSYGTPTKIVMTLDGREFARGELPYFNAESSRIGVTFVTG